MKKIRKQFEIENHRVKVAERSKGGDPCHMWGFPAGASGKKRACNVAFRSPHFSVKGFHRHTRVFCVDWKGYRPRWYFRLEKAMADISRVKRLRKR